MVSFLVHQVLRIIFDLVLSNRVHSNHPCPSVSLFVSLSLDIAETVHFFLIFLHEVKAPYGYKSDGARFLKKILGGHKWGKIPILEALLCFCPYLCIQSLPFS